MSERILTSAISARRSGRSALRSLRPFVVPLALLALWQALAPVEGTTTGIAPTPTGVLRGFWELTVSGELPRSILESLIRIASGFSIAFSAAVALGVMVGLWKPAEYLIDPLVETFRPIAPIAWIPLAILWFGTGTYSAMFIVGYAVFFPVFVNTVAGLRSIDQRLIDAARTLGAGRLLLVRDVVLPGALPSIVLGARIGMGVGWAAIIAAEMTVGSKSGGGASGGIGQMMFIFLSYSLELRYIIVGMITVGIIALLIDRGFRRLERMLTPWAQR
ncbi:MAG TPA: ABC transporter permease [Burkholderiaceae bacterium]|nr:ABC transporter permease [Burkholderiaceae bacterium]